MLKQLTIFEKVIAIIISSLLATHVGMQFTRQLSRLGNVHMDGKILASEMIITSGPFLMTR